MKNAIVEYLSHTRHCHGNSSAYVVAKEVRRGKMHLENRSGMDEIMTKILKCEGKIVLELM